MTWSFPEVQSANFSVRINTLQDGVRDQVFVRPYYVTSPTPYTARLLLPEVKGEKYHNARVECIPEHGEPSSPIQLFIGGKYHGLIQGFGTRGSSSLPNQAYEVAITLLQGHIRYLLGRPVQ